MRTVEIAGAPYRLNPLWLTIARQARAPRAVVVAVLGYLDWGCAGCRDPETVAASMQDNPARIARVFAALRTANVTDSDNRLRAPRPPLMVPLPIGSGTPDSNMPAVISRFRPGRWARLWQYTAEAGHARDGGPLSL